MDRQIDRKKERDRQAHQVYIGKFSRTICNRIDSGKGYKNNDMKDCNIKTNIDIDIDIDIYSGWISLQKKVMINILCFCMLRMRRNRHTQ